MSGTLRSMIFRLATAEQIMEYSGGEVTVDAAFDDAGNPVRGGLFCREIFGEDGSRFGHIELAQPVVHPWYSDVVRALTGLDDSSDGAAVLSALGEVGIVEVAEQVKKDQTGDEPGFVARCISAMSASGFDLRSLVLRALPVLPPAMRPHFGASSGLALSSDLNELYTRVIARNNALKELISGTGVSASGAYIKDAAARLSAAVTALIGDGSPGSLQSLTDMLRAENGFLKRNLQGKRADYSGRSVIVSGPDLKLTQCGLPREMALELFKPFVARRLVESGAASDSHSALCKIDTEPNSREVQDALDYVAAQRLVLLNRAPTLSRLSIQPFEPVLVDHRALMLHPLACYAFNADFDGDQMAVHIPITGAALSEARSLLDSADNLVSPANGKPVAGPVQDIVLGLYYLTADPASSEAVVYDCPEEVAVALQAGSIYPHLPVIVNDIEYGIHTTAGRVLFNMSLPPELRFTNKQVARSDLQELVSRCLAECGRERTRYMLDGLNTLGFEFATRWAPSFGLGTAPSSAPVNEIRREAMEADRALRADLRSGKINESQYSEKLWQTWNDAVERARAVVEQELASLNAIHPLRALIESGARGSRAHYGLNYGIFGCSWSGAAELVGLPSSWWDGTSQLEHFHRAFGARKGLIDSHVRIYSAIDMMKDLIYPSQDLQITTEDCGTSDGIEVRRIDFEGRTIRSLADRIRGRVAAQDVTDSTGEVIAAAGDLIDGEQAARIEAAGIESVRIRSVLSCTQRDGVCAMCYGEDPASGRMPEVGAAVGVVAAQAISEPAIQLTMRTFHGPTSPPQAVPSHPGGLVQMMDLFAGAMPELKPSEFVEKAQRIVGFQGVDINDKHFELIARRMYGFVRITSPGDTSLLKGDVVRASVLDSENLRVTEQGRTPAEAEPAVLGVFEAAKRSESIIASAAVGDAKSVLAIAALQGAKDDLKGALERIVAGLAP